MCDIEFFPGLENGTRGCGQRTTANLHEEQERISNLFQQMQHSWEFTISNHNHVNYIELPASDLEATKDFFKKVFGWQFVDYGTDYCSFLNAGIDGGFYRSELIAKSELGSVLVVLYSSALESSLDSVVAAGGVIIKPIFSFPGGRRFQFLDPSGNEFAVWSE